MSDLVIYETNKVENNEKYIYCICINSDIVLINNKKDKKFFNKNKFIAIKKCIKFNIGLPAITNVCTIQNNKYKFGISFEFYIDTTTQYGDFYKLVRREMVDNTIKVEDLQKLFRELYQNEIKSILNKSINEYSTPQTIKNNSKQYAKNLEDYISCFSGVKIDIRVNDIILEGI